MSVKCPLCRQNAPEGTTKENLDKQKESLAQPFIKEAKEQLRRELGEEHGRRRGKRLETRLEAAEKQAERVAAHLTDVIRSALREVASS